MGAYVARPVDEVAVALRQVMRRQVPYEALSVAGEAFWERDLLPQRHFKDLICVLVHEWGPPHDQLVHEDAERVPVGSATMAHIEDHLRCNVLWRATQGVRAIPRLQPLDKAEVGEFDEASVLN